MKTKIEYTVTKDTIHIKDSYKVTKKIDMLEILSRIKLTHYGSSYFFYMMPYKALLEEWRSHNLLYDLHLFRHHTKDVDLNKNPWYIRLAYTILSKFYIKAWFK